MVAVCLVVASGCTALTELPEPCGPGDLCDDANPCTSDACVEGGCVYQPIDATDALRQIEHDCKRFVCEAGLEVEVVDPSDVQPSDPCTPFTCSDAGDVMSIALDEGATCELGLGTGTCIDGACVVTGCVADNTICDDGRPCTNDRCDAALDLCVNESVPDGTPVPSDPVGDCVTRTCFQGEIESLADPDDVPDDGNACTTDSCDGNHPVHEIVAEGTSCGTSAVCRADGKCVGCTQPSDCDGTDTVCSWRTCDNDVCGVEYAPAGTLVADLTPCTEQQCDGSGGVTTVNKPSGTDCDDGVYCNGVDVCIGGQCPEATPPCPDVGDTDDDCNEACSEEDRACTAQDPDGSMCDDGLFCSSNDTCQGGVCEGGSPTCPGPDGDNNCKESCSEAADGCGKNDPDGSDCGSGQGVCNNGLCLLMQ